MTDNYSFDGREATVIIPPGAPNGFWIWRAEFLGGFDYADRALLEKGWHIVYYRVSDMYGCPQAIEYMKNFRDDVVRRYPLDGKADLFGFSRGGLYAANYALAHPEDVSSLYLDAPVLDICSWPGGKGKGIGAEREWLECLRCYGITEQEAETFTGTPVHQLRELARTGIPVILVAGDSDRVVPYEENGEKLYAFYQEHGFPIRAIVKPGVGHHPHSLEDPAEIVDFIAASRKR